MLELRKPERLPAELIEIWDELVELVDPEISPVGLEYLCSQVKLMRDARAKVKEAGFLVSDAKGDVGPNPAIAVERAAHAEIRKLLDQFSLEDD